jgi:hypothetical protein
MKNSITVAAVVRQIFLVVMAESKQVIVQAFANGQYCECSRNKLHFDA